LTKPWFLFTVQASDAGRQGCQKKSSSETGILAGFLSALLMEERNMHISDMVMHIGNKLGEDRRRNIEKALTGNGGVLHAHFNDKRPHLMLVSYDTDTTSSFEILARMTGQQLYAERVG
jgi:hypothetical protein